MKLSHTFVIVSILLSSGVSEAHADGVETIILGSSPSISVGYENFAILNSNDDEAALWKQTYEDTGSGVEDKMPSVDFDKYSVLAYTDSLKGTGGHTVEIEKVLQEKGKLQVFVKKTEPAEGCSVTASLERPLHWVKVPKLSRDGLELSLQVRHMKREKCGE